MGLELPAAAAPVSLVAAGVASSRVSTRCTTRATSSRGSPSAPAPASPRPGPDGQGLVIIANNQAGPALLPDPAARLAETLPAATVVDVSDLDRLQQALDDACRHASAIGVAGGDGSVSAAAASAHAAGLPLLVVPAGTLNRLATDLGPSAPKARCASPVTARP